MSGNEPTPAEADDAVLLQSHDTLPAIPPLPKDAIDSKLYVLTMTVVAQMDEMVTAYLTQDGYKYVPHRSVRKVKAFDSGWPNVGSEEKDESRIAHGDLFALKTSVIDPFAFDDIPGMAALKEYVTTTESVAEHVWPQNAAGSVPADLAERLMEVSICLFAESIYDRAMALGFSINDPAVADLYLQRERAWLAPTLDYQLVAPLLLTNIDIRENVLQIAADIRIERLTDDELRRMSEVDRLRALSPLADAAKWAVVADMPPIANLGEGKSLFVADDPIDATRVDAVCDAIRIVSQARPGLARIFRRPQNWATGWKDDLPNLDHVETSRRFPSEFESAGWLKTHPGVTSDEAKQLPVVFAALTKASPQAQLATRRLSMAMLRDAPDDQLIDACIGLEAILGQEGAELSYRVAVRAAALLSSHPGGPRKPEVIFKAARKVYDRRSELVHGSTKNKNASFELHPGDEPMPTHVVAVWLLQDVLHQRLTRPEWTVKELDALILSGLDQTTPSASGAGDVVGTESDETVN